MARGGRQRIVGVDFSGAVDAGNGIWLAEGESRGDRFRVDAVFPARDLPGSSADRDEALDAVRRYIAARPGAVFALDFPFGLPRPLVPSRTWTGFLRWFARSFDDPATFKNAMSKAAGGRDLKRRTDRETKTPFSPYNLRMHKQTFYGLRRLIAPLVIEGRATAPPMVPMRSDAATLLEICPASVLKVWGLYAPYKGSGEALRAGRESILHAIEARGLERIGSAGLRERIVDDRGGDALDAVVAALAASKVVGHAEALAETNGDYAIEARVFVPGRD